MSILSGSTDQKTIYLFNRVITNEDLFGELRDYRELIAGKLYAMLTAKRRSQLLKYPAPVIGVHIRRGDFKLGNQTTPLNYFINTINLIRQTVNENLPVTIFTDADKHELSELFQLPGIFIAQEKPDILDILLLSKSKIIVLSRSSTFGYWAAFLSDALVIRSTNDWQEKISTKNKNYIDIKWELNDTDSTLSFTQALTKVCCYNINHAS